jgi:hypothetical protein
MRDLTDASSDEVAAERARVAVEGWGAQLLALQGTDGQWDGGTYRPGWVDESKPFFDAWTATHFSGPRQRRAMDSRGYTLTRRAGRRLQLLRQESIESTGTGRRRMCRIAMCVALAWSQRRCSLRSASCPTRGRCLDSRCSSWHWAIAGSYLVFDFPVLGAA